jgi:PTS system fructose-specific IIC component
VNILRFLRPECIRLGLETVPTEPREDETQPQRDARLVEEKEAVLRELAELLDLSGEVVNPTKFHRDLVNRERKATTAILPGIAIPHVRTMQARSFIMGFARAAAPGLHFASLDGTPTRIFFLLASPPYEDRIYLQVYREFAEVVRDERVIDALEHAREPNEVFNALRAWFR